ncbi:MAG: sugar ABC transporter substrate-binding protein [Bacillota bacterium]
MKNRKISLLVVFVFLTTLLSSAVWFFKEENKPKVIVVIRRIDSEYWKIFESGAKKAFQDFNISGQVIAPESQYPISNQPNLLKKVLKENPDALIVAPTVPKVVYPVLMEYKKRNIPVFITNTSVDWKYTAYIGTDNTTLGKTAGMLLGSMLQPGDQVAIIHGRVNDGISITRKNSAKKALEAIGVEIVAEEVGYDRLKKPIPVIGNILQTYPNLKGVVGTTDRLALEALQDIEEKQLKIPVIGADGIASMVETVKAGKITATIAQNPYDAGYLSVAQAHKKLKGENIDLRIHSGIDIITEYNAKEKLDFLQKNMIEE